VAAAVGGKGRTVEQARMQRREGGRTPMAVGNKERERERYRSRYGCSGVRGEQLVFIEIMQEGMCDASTRP
jgi:hypothetical protein